MCAMLDEILRKVTHIETACATCPARKNTRRFDYIAMHIPPCCDKVRLDSQWEKYPMLVCAFTRPGLVDFIDTHDSLHSRVRVRERCMWWAQCVTYPALACMAQGRFLIWRRRTYSLMAALCCPSSVWLISCVRVLILDVLFGSSCRGRNFDKAPLHWRGKRSTLFSSAPTGMTISWLIRVLVLPCCIVLCVDLKAAMVEKVVSKKQLIYCAFVTPVVVFICVGCAIWQLSQADDWELWMDRELSCNLWLMECVVSKFWFSSNFKQQHSVAT